MVWIRFFHGCSDPANVRDGRFTGFQSARGQLFLSRSVNVARRYAANDAVFEVELDVPDNVTRISVERWLGGAPSEWPEGPMFIIEGERDCYDFPVDTLVIQSEFDRPFAQVTQERLDELDDGLAFRHDPASPDDRQFDVYLSDFYEGDAGRWVFEMERLAEIGLAESVAHKKTR